MANKKYKLDGNDYWEASGVYDIGQGATQCSINDEVVTKLATIEEGAEVNQNAFSNVTVGGTTIAADSKTGTLTLTAGSNITLTPNATNDNVTIAATDTTYGNATQSAAGLMSAADKKKLDTLDSSDITDNSTVGGSTVEASLTSLKGSLNTEVTARQTADKNIQGLITAYVETGTTASRAYGKGQIIEVGGKLYSVIQPIASGAAFTVGTNIESTTVGNEFSKFVLVESTLTFNTGTAFFYDGHIKANSKLFAGLSYLTPGSTSGTPRLYFVTVQPNIDGRAVVYIRNADGSVPSTIELTVYLIISNQV